MSFKEGDTRHDFQVKCPYNPSHQMPNSRLFYHITQGCQDKARVEHLFDHCPYNFLHIISIADMENHIRQCKDAQSTEGNLMAEMQNLMIANKKKPKVQQQQQNTVPGFSGEQPEKKKRIRNKKNKQPPQEKPKETGIPQWGADSEEENDKIQKEITNQFEEKLEITQEKVQPEKQNDESDGGWEEIAVKPKKGRRKDKEY